MQLSAHYAEDHLTTQELEERFDRAYRAASAADLLAVVARLPALREPARAPVPRASMPSLARPVAVAPERRHLAVMSTLRKAGDWTPSPLNTVRAVMATVRIDLRDASFVDAEVTFDILAVMSEVKLIVPPGIRVECDGMALLGEFSDRHDASGGDAEAPIVRVRGSSVMANIRVETRLPGETKLEAWRRARLERGARSDD